MKEKEIKTTEKKTRQSSCHFRPSEQIKSWYRKQALKQSLSSGKIVYPADLYKLAAEEYYKRNK